MQPNMPDKDSPTSGEVDTAAAILTVIVAMAVGMCVYLGIVLQLQAN